MPHLLAATNYTTTATTPDPLGHLAWAVIAGAVIIVAVARAIRLPGAAWKHGDWSKVAWILAALFITWSPGGLIIPIGAIAAMHQTRRPKAPVEGEVPYAEGQREQ